MDHACGCESAACNRSKMSYTQKTGEAPFSEKEQQLTFPEFHLPRLISHQRACNKGVKSSNRCF